MEDVLLAIKNAANTIATPTWADKISIFISLIAVIIAAIVAWKQIEISKKQNQISLAQVEIADKQNKIALFEKQYELYTIISNIILIDEFELEYIKNPWDMCEKINHIFDVNVELGQVLDINITRVYIVGKLEKLYQLEFLLPKDVYNQIMKLSLKFSNLVSRYALALKNYEFEELKDEFHQAANEIRDNMILESIKSQLKL